MITETCVRKKRKRWNGNCKFLRRNSCGIRARITCGGIKYIRGCRTGANRKSAYWLAVFFRELTCSVTYAVYFVGFQSSCNTAPVIIRQVAISNNVTTIAVHTNNPFFPALVLHINSRYFFAE